MNTEHRKTLSSFSISSTNIRSLCTSDKKKRLRKLLAIKNLDTDISVIIDSQVNQADESFLYKHHRLLMSEYNIISKGRCQKHPEGGVYQFCALRAPDADPPHFRRIRSVPPPKCRYSVYTPPKSTTREKILRRKFWETTPKKQKNCKYTL